MKANGIISRAKIDLFVAHALGTRNKNFAMGGGLRKTFNSQAISDRLPETPVTRFVASYFALLARLMRAKLFGKRTRFLLPAFLCLLLVLANQIVPHDAHSQSNKLTLISEETSTRAVAVDSVTQTHEPFSTTEAVSWGPDSHTRIMIFAMGLSLQPGETAADVTADAEDGAHHIYHLPVEYVGPVPAQDWIRKAQARQAALAAARQFASETTHALGKR